jgi:hypothetical protein
VEDEITQVFLTTILDYVPSSHESTMEVSSYFDHIDQVKRGLRPRSPRPSGPVVRNGRAASLGGIFA